LGAAWDGKVMMVVVVKGATSTIDGVDVRFKLRSLAQ